jgi:hypothetical protein
VERLPEDSFHQDGFALAGGRDAELGFRLEKHPGISLIPLTPATGVSSSN